MVVFLFVCQVPVVLKRTTRGVRSLLRLETSAHLQVGPCVSVLVFLCVCEGAVK